MLSFYYRRWELCEKGVWHGIASLGIVAVLLWASPVTALCSVSLLTKAWALKPLCHRLLLGPGGDSSFLIFRCLLQTLLKVCFFHL